MTTEAKAKEIRKIAEGLIAMAVREKDNFETVTVTAKVARKDADGKTSKRSRRRQESKQFTMKFRKRSRKMLLPDFMHVVR